MIHLTCKYCNNKWIKQIYSNALVNTDCCPKCNDSNIVIKELSDAKIDYYKGCTPFADEKYDQEQILNDWNIM